MYSREFTQAPENIIQNRKAVFGTYSGVSASLDIRGMLSPYAGLPLPSFISRIRIKSRFNFYFSLEDYIGMAEFYDFKALSLAEIAIWNKSSGKKYVYHKIMGPRHRLIPSTTAKGRCATNNKSRDIKVTWGRNHSHTILTFRLKGDSVRPNIEGYCMSKMDDAIHSDALFVSPSPASSRCSATWFNGMSVKGKVEVNNQQEKPTSGLAAMILNRTYYKFRSKGSFCIASGNIKGKQVIFYIKSTNMDAANSYAYNDNILTVDGKKTALPPVYITHSFGTDKTWIIQDTESMIDLSFTPVSTDKRELNIIALRRSYSTLYGTFEGTLLTSEGEKLTFKGLNGIISTGSLRL